MSEKLLTPLDIMPPALHHAVETTLKKFQTLDQNPSPASYSSLGKPYEALKSLWVELQWKHCATDLQALEASLTQQQAERPTLVQQKLRELRGSYARSFQQRRQRLTEKKESWQQTKQALRNSMNATRNGLAEKSRLLTLPSEQLIEQQLLSYASEWTSAGQRIETQKTRLRQAEASYPSDLQQHKNTLRTAFEQLEQRLSEKERNAPLTLQRLQQWSGQRRSALPGLVATWETAASARETRLQEELDNWKAQHPTSADEVPSWPKLKARAQQLAERRQSLTERSQALQQRKQRLTSAEQTMQTEWQRVSGNPGFSAPPSSEQRMDWLRKSRPLKDALSELHQLMRVCAALKAKLLTAGFLAADEYPEIDAAWAEGA